MNDALLQSAVRAHQAGNLAEAARLYDEVLRANPRHFPAMYAMGFLHYQIGRFEEASRIIGDALRINPRSPDAFFTRGCALQHLNRASEALVCFDSALALKPGFVEAQSNRGMALMALNRDEQALESIEVALALDPSNAGSWNNRGCILEKSARHEEALLCFAKAIASQPRSAEALINHGSALASLKRYEDAAADFAKALAIDPERPSAQGNLVLFRMHACDWRSFARDKAETAAALRAGRPAIYPFVNLALSDSVAEQLQCARILAANDAPASPTPLWRGETYRHDRIRVAYVSADFHAHATAALMAGVFEQHDRSRFEIVAISFGKDDKSDMRGRVRRAFDHFIEVRERSDSEIASLMRQMEIDIAIDLKGYTLHHRSGIFAHRPAPVQASYLGYPGTMGAPYIDYILADRIVIPESHMPFYTEQVVYLPDSYQCNDVARPIAEPSTRAQAGLPEAGFVFCCFNNNFKIAPEIFAIWMRLLHEVPDSVLWLLEDNPDSMRNLRREADARGVAPDRLIFAARIDASDHLARHRLADLFLDTQPYGAHTTASDALRAGLPVLTVEGPTFAARVAASLLHAVGMPELVTPSLQTYETAALALARDTASLDALKAKLARNRATHPLFDTRRFAGNLETAYAIMWERCQRGEAPRSFSLDQDPPPSVAPQNAPHPRQIPESALSAFAQGCALAGQNRAIEALACFEEALAIDPRFAEAHTNRGAVLLALKHPEAALLSFDAALSIDPGLVEAWNNRGNVLSALGRHEEAVASFDRVLATRPQLFEAQVNRGTALLASRRMDEAFASYDKALRIRPDSADALNGRANALFELKRFEEAISDYEGVLRLNPEHAYVAGNLAFARLHCCDWRFLNKDRERLNTAIGQSKPVVNPFQNLALSRSAAAQKQCATLWVADKYPAAPKPLWNGERYGHERIRIAYLSADFRDHAVAQSLAGVFERHDKARFETTAISWGAPDESEMRTRLVGAFDQFIDAERMSDSELARRLRAMEIDIAVDLMGFTGECRPGVLALRPAPIQVNYLGFPGTMGAPYMDCLIADPVVILESDRGHYSENIINLPDCYLPTDSKRRIAAVPTRRQAGLPEMGFVFASFNNSYKFSPEVFDIWMRLLRATEGSVLWLSAVNLAAARNLKHEAEARKIDAGRLVFAPFLARSEDHLARLTLADLFLDTLPYNAHATAADGLWAGVPLVTAAGRTFAGRVAASLLQAVGLTELIAESLEAYEILALKLASEPLALATVKAKLAAHRETHALFDTANFTRNLEGTYLTLWEGLGRNPSPTEIG
jgi:predicted O-linked N-acetylglucosamine transferase (SPINDLY family)